MRTGKLNLALIASGGGTDASAIIMAHKTRVKGLGNVGNIYLISTKADAGCIDRWKYDKVVDLIVIDRKSYGKGKPGLKAFNEELGRIFIEKQIDLVFLVGCIHMVYPISGISMYNIHPAEIPKHGGKGMYGLEPHISVLNEITSQLPFGIKKLEEDRFFTYPTVHEVTDEFDKGQPLLTGCVEIPKELIRACHNTEVSFEEAASQLQQIVLSYEWKILPAAVEMVAHKIITERRK